MRIVVLGIRGFPKVQGGAEAHCENLYPQLAKYGCEVYVLGRKAYIGDQAYVYEGVNLVPLPCIRHKYLEAFVHTFLGIFAARKYNPDILHIHSIGPGFFIPLARLLGYRVVLTTHGENYRHLKWGFLARLFFRMSEYLAVTSANAVIAISKTIAESAKSKFRKSVTYIPNGVRLPEPVNTDASLQKFGLSKGQYYLSVGRFVPEKGFHDLIDAYAQLEGGQWKLVLAGGADHEDVYSRSLKEKAAATPGVVLTGFLTGTPLQEIYSHAGMFVLPSYYEGLPIVLLEALSYGLSSLASDIPANREVELEENRYFLPGKVDALRDKMRELKEQVPSSEQKETRRQQLRENHDWQKIAEKTRAVYQEVLL